jgi:hypothetical protein
MSLWRAFFSDRYEKSTNSRLDWTTMTKRDARERENEAALLPGVKSQ